MPDTENTSSVPNIPENIKKIGAVLGSVDGAISTAEKIEKNLADKQQQYSAQIIETVQNILTIAKINAKKKTEEIQNNIDQLKTEFFSLEGDTGAELRSRFFDSYKFWYEDSCKYIRMWLATELAVLDMPTADLPFLLDCSIIDVAEYLNPPCMD